jgi:hypothetical protein
MGFLGFLKKKEELAAPQKPQDAPAPAAPPAPPPDLFGGDIPPPPKPDPFSFDSHPSEIIIHDDVHHDSDLDNLPLPDMDSVTGEPAQAVPSLEEPESAPEAPAAMPELPELKSARDEAPLPELSATPTPQPQIVPLPKPMEAMPEAPPDFSDEQIFAAEKMTRHGKRSEHHPEREHPLPPLREVAGFLPPEVPDSFYVHATQYQAALKTISSFKTAVKKGDAAIAQMEAAMASHKQQFAVFAEQVNGIQEALIRIDNIMISQR